MSHVSGAVALSGLFRITARAALALALSVGTAVISAARTLPGDAEFAKAAEFSYPYVKAGKRTLRLAASARIYNERNLIIMPATMPAKASVLFKIDINGQIARVWLLTDEEAKAYEDNK